MKGFTFKQRLNLQLALIKASVLGYMRDGAAIFFTLLFPLIFMVVFGLLNFGGNGGFSELNIGVADNANTASSRQFIASLQTPDVPLNLTAENVRDETALREALSDGDIEALLIIPSNFDIGADVPARPSMIELLATPNVVAGLGVVYVSVGEVLDGLVLADAGEQFRTENYAALGEAQLVASSGQDVSYRVFLIPGILAMAIMQSAVFGLIFTLARFKVQGVLRRFQGTPAGSSPFLFAEMVSRLIVLVVATALLMGIGMALFGDYRETILDGGVGVFASTFVIALLGIFVFLGWALAFTGRTKSENAAAGIANLTTLPMLFLSGVFFPTSVLPDWLAPITQYLPLTFLIDALRMVQVDGAALWSADVGWEILGLAVWAVGLFIVARLLFRWD